VTAGPAARRADFAFFAALAAGLLLVVFLGPLDRRLELVRDNDFSGFWAGARALVTGRDPYDTATWAATTLVLGTQAPDTAVYGYPPWVALALVPLALLPLEAAAWLWMIAGVVLAALALRALLRACLPGNAPAHAAIGLALLMSQPGFHALVLGQWSFLLVAALAAVVLALRRGHGGRAGLAALALLAKPQLVVIATIGLAVAALRGDPARRAAAVAAAGAAAIVVGSTLALPHWWPAWSAAVAPQRLAHPASLATALGDLLGGGGGPLALALTVAGVAAALAFRPGGDASLAVWLALSLAGAPYLWSYDHLLLIVPLVLAAGALATRDTAAATRLVVACAAVLLLASPLLYVLAVARHRESFSAIVPLAFFVALATACRPVRDV